MQFEVNGRDYFLVFAEDDERWYVFAPTRTGVNRIPVYVDAAAWPASSVAHGLAPDRKPE
ncbi:MAG: hypothetical protein JO266_08605 [Acidobacteria bacterium]|nr:hypothetical protein [Acidobacteriota bacterium]